MFDKLKQLFSKKVEKSLEEQIQELQKRREEMRIEQKRLAELLDKQKGE